MWKLWGGIATACFLALIIYTWTPGPPKADLAGLKKLGQKYNVTIHRDKWGVPHIYGKSDADTAFGFAYAHAEDDWETIQQTLLFSRGTLAQEIGKGGAPTDYLADLLKIDSIVTEKYDTDLRESTKAYVEAYVDGINLYGAEHPDETLSGILPVKAADVLKGFLFRTPFFYGFDEDLTELMKDERSHPISTKGINSFLLNGTPPDQIGSNAFAIAPTRSADRHTRFIVNSHQPFTGPVAWYEARLKSEETLDIIGATFPGSPLISVGATPHIAWGHTVNKPDLVDIYLLDTDRKTKPRRYKLDGQWHDFDQDTASFRVKLFGPFSWPVSKPLLYSIHGPVIETKHGVYAFKYAGDDDLGAIEQWLDMNAAQTMSDFRAAFKRQGIPSFNTLVADKTGNIGFIYNAKMPIRANGWNWQHYLPGDTSETLWQGYHPIEELPQIFNPPSGWLFSANATPFNVSDAGSSPDPSAYPDYYGTRLHLTNRAMRALEVISPDPSITREELLQYRSDQLYASQSPIQKMVQDILKMEFDPDSVAAQAQEILMNWDGSTDLKNRGTALAVITGVRSITPLLDQPPKNVRENFIQTAEELKKHHGRVDPEWQDVNRLRRGELDIPVNGGPDILRAIYSDATEISKTGTMTAVAGDTYILVADWTAEGELTVDSIHQFGSATLDKKSPHYADQAELFAQGDYKTIPMTLEELRPTITRSYQPGR